MADEHYPDCLNSSSESEPEKVPIAALKRSKKKANCPKNKAIPKKPPTKKASRGKGYWNLDREIILCTFKKDEDMLEKEDRNYRMKTGKEKWDACAEMLQSKGLKGQDGGQLKRKYTNLFSDYKKINDWQKRSGALCWWNMDDSERKESEVKMIKKDFEEELYNFMSAFLSTKHNVNPPVIVDSGTPIKKSGAEFSTTKETKTSTKKSEDDGVKKESDVCFNYYATEFAIYNSLTTC